jgi:hypothetical protein
MSLTPDQAAQALSDIETARARTRVAMNYRDGGLHLIAWGALIMAGHVMTEIAPEFAGVVWISVNAAGFAASLILGFLHRAKGGQGRPAALLAIGLALCFATELIVPQATGRQISVVWALHAGAAYMIAGLWLGRAYLMLGAAVVTLSLFGYFAVDAHFNLWMGAVFGGSVLASGLWMRRSP